MERGIQLQDGGQRVPNHGNGGQALGNDGATHFARDTGRLPDGATVREMSGKDHDSQGRIAFVQQATQPVTSHSSLINAEWIPN